MAMMTPLEWQQWAQGARRGQQGALSRLLPALQFQAAQQAYQQGGTQGLLRGGFFPQAQAAATAGLRRAQRGEVEQQSELLGQVLGGGAPGSAPALGGGGATGGVRGASADDLLRLSLAYGAADRSEAANVFMRAREAMRKPANELLDDYQRVTKPIVEELRDVTSDWSNFRSRDYRLEGGNPVEDAVLAKFLIQTVEPGLQVTTAEGETVIEAGTSDIGAIGQRILRTTTEAGTFTPTTRRLIVEAVENAFRNRATELQRFVRGTQDEAARQFQALGRPELVGREALGSEAPLTLYDELAGAEYDFAAVGRRPESRAAFESAASGNRNTGEPTPEELAEAAAIAAGMTDEELGL